MWFWNDARVFFTRPFLLPHNDPVPPSTSQYHLILIQYHPVSTSTLYWPSTSTNQYLKEYQLADLCSSTWRHINAHQGSSLTRATCNFSILRTCLAQEFGLVIDQQCSWWKGSQIQARVPPPFISQLTGGREAGWEYYIRTWNHV